MAGLALFPGFNIGGNPFQHFNWLKGGVGIIVVLHKNPCLSDLVCLEDPFLGRFCLRNILWLLERYVDVMELDINSMLMIPKFILLLQWTVSARNIGVILVKTLCLNDHMTKICQTCHYWLKSICLVRRCLSLTATQLLVQVLVLSILDYCNALYVGLPQQQLVRLQCIQNAAARLITCTPRQEHISPVLMHLHWFKVPQRIIFKKLTLTFLAIHGKAPTYICELVEQHTL